MLSFAPLSVGVLLNFAISCLDSTVSMRFAPFRLTNTRRTRQGSLCWTAADKQSKEVSVLSQVFCGRPSRASVLVIEMAFDHPVQVLREASGAVFLRTLHRPGASVLSGFRTSSLWAEKRECQIPGAAVGGPVLPQATDILPLSLVSEVPVRLQFGETKTQLACSGQNSGNLAETDTGCIPLSICASALTLHVGSVAIFTLIHLLFRRKKNLYLSHRIKCFNFF